MMEVSRKITKLYASMESMEASLGGGGGFEGFYGSVTANGVSRVYESMSETCGFDKDSFLVDVGGGVGRPLVHALVQPGLKTAVGLELDEIKCLKSESVIRESFTVARQLAEEDGCVEPRVIHRDIEKVNATGTLDPATHAYAFWEGIPVRARKAFGELFAKSSTLRSVAIVQRAIRRQSPAELMTELNFGSLELVDTLKGIHMSGSNRSFTAYVFKRLDPPGPSFTGSEDALLSSLLTAPRLLQTSLPRMLRRRTPNRVYASEAPAPVAAKAKPKAPRGRVALVDTMPQLRTAAVNHTDAADQEAAQAALGLPQGGITAQPADEQCCAQGAYDNQASVHQAVPDGGHGRNNPRQSSHIESAASQRAKAAGKKPAGRRKGAVKQEETAAQSGAGVAAGRTRSACAELSNRSLRHGSVEDLPTDSSKVQTVSGRRKKNCAKMPDAESAPESLPHSMLTRAYENKTPCSSAASGGGCTAGSLAARKVAAATHGGCILDELCSNQLSPGKRDADAPPLPASPTKRSCGEQGQECT